MGDLRLSLCVCVFHYSAPSVLPVVKCANGALQRPGDEVLCNSPSSWRTAYACFGSGRRLAVAAVAECHNTVQPKLTVTVEVAILFMNLSPIASAPFNVSPNAMKVP